VENDITEISKRVNELAGIKESDTGLAPPALWDLAADKQSMQSEQPLQVLLLNLYARLQCFGSWTGSGSPLDPDSGVLKRAKLKAKTQPKDRYPVLVVIKSVKKTM
jgi:hypothetical protein